LRGDGSRRARREPARLLLFGFRAPGLPPVTSVGPHILPILMEIPPVVPDVPGILVEARAILAERLPVFGAGGAVLPERLPGLLEGRPIGGDGGLVPGLPIRLELLPVLPVLLPGLPDGLVILLESLGILPEVLPILLDGLPVLPEVPAVLPDVLLVLRHVLRPGRRPPQGQGQETSYCHSHQSSHGVASFHR